MSTSASQVPACLFCKISAKENPETELLYEDADIVAFRDIHPATDRHFLIVPKRHLVNAKALTAADSEIVNQLVRVGKELLTKDGIRMEDQETRMGFHWPPFNGIHHLHLHVLNPVSKMGLMGRMFFRPDSWWFVSPETVLQILSSKSAKSA